MKKGDTIQLDIESYAFEGKGISKINLEDSDKKYVIFVNGSYPGDKVEAKLRKVKKSFAEGNAEKIITASPERVEARCKYFGTCGGCKQQDLNYDSQIKYKEMQVREVFEHIGGLKDFKSLPILPSKKIFYYRNKMEFSFSNQRWLTDSEVESTEEIEDKNFALGLHIPRQFEKVLDIDVCYLQSEISAEILNFTRDFFKLRKATIYTTKTHSGYLRNLVIKQAHKTEDLMVNLVTSEDNPKWMKEYSEKLIEHFPEITTIINNVNLKKAQVAIGDFEKVYFGGGVIYDFIGKHNFRISANSFFQTNTFQAEGLYETAKEFAEFTGDEIVYDLYSGAGTIAIFISDKVKKVMGFESVTPAVNDAISNAKLNEIDNCDFYEADLNKSFLPVVEEKNLPGPDVIIADPPRAGMNPKTVKDILELKPGKIVYVSCNPTTQARDIKALSEEYELVKIRPVDMFPHTFHIENVALLKRIN